MVFTRCIGQQLPLISAAPSWQTAAHQGTSIAPEGFRRNLNALVCGKLSSSLGGCCYPQCCSEGGILMHARSENIKGPLARSCCRGGSSLALGWVMVPRADRGWGWLTHG
jgi:hypothetical protein